MRSRLIAVNKDIGKDKILSISTIGTFAMAVMVLLKYIMHQFKDDDVQKPFLLLRDLGNLEKLMSILSCGRTVLKSNGYSAVDCTASLQF